MKKVLFTLLLNIIISTSFGQQSFERLYQYWNYGEGNEVFTEEGGYIMAGFGKNDTTNYLFILKADLTGDTLWLRNYGFGHNQSNYPWIRSSVKDIDGNTYFAISGTGDTLSFVKFNPQWELVWKKSLGQNFSISKMIYSEDNHILAVGRDNAGDCIRKLDTTGSTLWRSQNIWYNQFGSLVYSSILEMPDKNIVTISSWVNNTYYTITPSTITTYSSSGDSVSSAIFDPESRNYNITETHLIGGELFSICRGNQYTEMKTSLIRHNVDGTILMDKLFKTNAFFYKMVITNDNKIIASGGIQESSIERIVLHSTTLEGDSLWTSYIGYSREIWAYSIKLCSDNGLLLGGFSSLSDWPYGHPYLVRTDSLGRISPLSIAEAIKNTVQVFPNPANDKVVFETPGNSKGRIIIYDAYGRQCASLIVSEERTTFDTKNLAPGIYIYTVSDHMQVYTGKLIVKSGQ
jgi:hypothetical protein